MREWITPREVGYFTDDSRKTVDRVVKRLVTDNSELIRDNDGGIEIHRDVLTDRTPMYSTQLELLFDYFVREGIQMNTHNSTWAKYLITYNWKVFGTITFDKPKGLSASRTYMGNLIDKVSKKYKIYRYFYSSEPSSDGYHIHFVFDCRSESTKKIINLLNDEVYHLNRRLIEEYDYTKLGASYLTKFLKNNVDGYEIG